MLRVGWLLWCFWVVVLGWIVGFRLLGFDLVVCCGFVIGVFGFLGWILDLFACWFLFCLIGLIICWLWIWSLVVLLILLFYICVFWFGMGVMALLTVIWVLCLGFSGFGFILLGWLRIVVLMFEFACLLLWCLIVCLVCVDRTIDRTNILINLTD